MWVESAGFVGFLVALKKPRPLRKVRRDAGYIQTRAAGLGRQSARKPEKLLPTTRKPAQHFHDETHPMALPDSYTLKIGSVPAYFDAMLDAQPPERFSVKFLENLGFTSTNDRLFIGILKDLVFLNRDGTPQQRYFDFLDRSRSKVVLADGIREAYVDLFAINTKANDFTAQEAKNKLRTLYAGKKTDLVIGNISKTFRALCDYADFSGVPLARQDRRPTEEPTEPTQVEREPVQRQSHDEAPTVAGKIKVSGLQYHINIVLPDTRDQAVFDAIFKSLRDHLG